MVRKFSCLTKIGIIVANMQEADRGGDIRINCGDGIPKIPMDCDEDFGGVVCTEDENQLLNWWIPIQGNQWRDWQFEQGK